MSAVSPYILGLVAVICYAAMTPISKKLQLDIPPFAFVGIASAMLCVFAAAISFFFEKDFSLTKITPDIWGGMTILVLVNLAGYVLYLMAISKMPATQYQLLYLVGPIVAAGLAYLLLREPFKIQYLYGLVIITAGLFVALRGGTQ